jgi:hypothetical protein
MRQQRTRRGGTFRDEHAPFPLSVITGTYGRAVSALPITLCQPAMLWRCPVETCERTNHPFIIVVLSTNIGRVFLAFNTHCVL